MYNSKKHLKSDPEKIFITENLTSYRNELVKELSNHKTKNDISAYWTYDGRIYAKKNERSNRKLIRNHGDIRELIASRSTASENRDFGGSFGSDPDSYRPREDWSRANDTWDTNHAQDNNIWDTNQVQQNTQPDQINNVTAAEIHPAPAGPPVTEATGQ